MSYGQSSYGGLPYGDTQTVLLPEFIDVPALGIAVSLHAPEMRITGVLQPGVLTVTVTMHEPLVREQAVPIAQDVRRMRVGQRE